MTNATAPLPGFNENELESLQKLFIKALIYLWGMLFITLILTSLLVTINGVDFVWISIIAGILGSTFNGLTSALKRHANGFEDRAGNQTPDPDTEKERFNEGMYYWFLVRPWFGGVIGAVTHWGFASEIFSPAGGLQAYLTQPHQPAFYGFLVGFLAKTLVSIFKGLLNNIFKQ